MFVFLDFAIERLAGKISPYRADWDNHWTDACLATTGCAIACDSSLSL
jgi:hypothetical protein